MALNESFVRFPTTLLEALMRSRLTRSQHLIVLWLIRQTYGWNCGWTAFTWYRIAREIGLHRAPVYRAGQALLKAGVLIRKDNNLGIQPNPHMWTGYVEGVAAQQRKAVSTGNADVAEEQRPSCREATLFRRTKDSSKDKLKTYKDRRIKFSAGRHRKDTGDNERHHLGGAATPVSDKYDGLSQN